MPKKNVNPNNRSEVEDLIGDGPVPASDRKVTRKDNGAGTVAAKQLKSFIERIERLAEDKSAVQNDIKEVFQEARGQGYDPKIMRRVLRERKKDVAERQEEEALFDTYMHALGLKL